MLTRTIATRLATLAAVTFPIAGWAQSTVVLYGLVDASARYATNAQSGARRLVSLNDGAFTGSRLGFKGTEGLGDDLKAIFALEMGFDPSAGVFQQANSAATFGNSAAPTGRAFGREAWVGLTSTIWGTLQLGRQYTIAHTLSTRFQPLTNPNQDSLSVFSGHHVARQDNMVKLSRNVGPFQLLGSVTASEGNGKSYSVGGGYAAAPFDVVLYGERLRTPTGTDQRTVWGTGGNFQIVQGLKLWAGYSKQTQESTPQVNRIATGAVSWFATPLLQLTALYTQDQQSGIAAAGKRKLGAVAADYFLSKRTDVYLEIDQNTLSGTFPQPAFMATRDRQRGVSVGLRHSF